MNDFLIKYHPWNLLKENTFPENDQLLVMKGVMDGKSYDKIAKELSSTNRIVRNNLAKGMETVRVKNLYELIVWGLRTGVIRDTPIDLEKIKSVKSYGFESYPKWLQVLNLTVSGRSAQEISIEIGITKSSIEHYRDFVEKEFGLGGSLAEYIRFGFRALNSISAPASVRGYKPFKAWKSPYSTLEQPPMLSKFRPANIDPNIPVYDKTAKRDIPPADFKPKISIPRSKSPFAKKLPPPPVKSTSIQTALHLLGIDRNIIAPRNLKSSGSFWSYPPEHIWKLLSLAKRRYELEIAHAHPDRGGDMKRAAQLNAAWKLVKKLFARRGFEMHR